MIHFLYLGFLVSILAGCGAGPAPRLIDLMGKEAFEPGELSVATPAWARLPEIGLIVHSDATAPNAAPALTAEYVDILAQRTEEYLKQHCAFQKIIPSPLLVQLKNFPGDLQALGDRLNVSYLVLVLLTSFERTGPGKFGEATMMTQINGSIIENTAVAEVGVLQFFPFKMIFLESGKGTEVLEQLDAPIGNSTRPPSTAVDILRARAGQNALDRALERFVSAC